LFVHLANNVLDFNWSSRVARTHLSSCSPLRNGENRIEARGASHDEAWRNAVLQAEAVGMAGQFRGG
jgi:hypothetical protein